MPPQDSFPTTQWTLVVDCSDATHERRLRALEELCKIYWKPVYAFYLQTTGQKADAEDLTQGLFTRLFDSNFFQNAQQVKGKFRDFLKGSAKNHALTHHRSERTQKRGGHFQFVSLNEEDPVQSPAPGLEPDLVFDREWALTLLSLTLAQLCQECEQNGKQRLFEKLKPALAGEVEIDTAILAAELGMTVNALRVAQHRLVKRCREIFKARIAQTLPDQSEVDDEMLHLSRTLRVRL